MIEVVPGSMIGDYAKVVQFEVVDRMMGAPQG
jgi:hypothetical protein